MRGKLFLMLGALTLAGLAFVGGVVAERHFFSRPAVLLPPIPLVPAEGGVVKNGKGPRDTALVWDFEWSSVPGARKYRVYVIFGRSGLPMADETVNEPRFRMIRPGMFVSEPNLSGWIWKVKAEYPHGWSDWSEERTFSVEPLPKSEK